MATRQIRSGKTVSDNTQAQALKSDIKATANMLHALLRKIRKEQVPTNWKEGHLIKIQRKISETEICRGITLLSAPGSFQQSVAERDERFGVRRDSRSTGRIP
ncbi:unnamed protein product [Schistosoma curassoni]|uniref:Transposase n=1 Tax=Schistosoma curassoni TaxID=6186 RepID=A0A183JRW9_9TREM|nr:unnamed protein product [Schistosoma curassoni]